MPIKTAEKPKLSAILLQVDISPWEPKSYTHGIIARDAMLVVPDRSSMYVRSSFLHTSYHPKGVDGAQVQSFGNIFRQQWPPATQENALS